ncbi:SigE family RNA polymerase sigma factor [Rugosimonospora africana]|uniref:SigE family RNA polymerase sigma factor n=1 Tax=Rugosimonospora africana TaxID=556532 RepID=UPI001944801D|nr:SigE family RNA polymerase sigma factor [Rugosimonospora africana]
MRVQAVERDRCEFAEFYAAAADDCLRVVVLVVGNRQLAEDLVAEAFTKAWLSWRKVHQLDEPRAWVVRVALNSHVSWWRRHRREVALGDHDRATTGTEPHGLDSALMAALRRLPVRQREVVTLRLLLDMDTATTARTLGMPTGTVASHLHRALAALRREIPSFNDQELTR